MWTCYGEPFTSADIGDHVGFVYVLNDLENGMRYIGKETFWFRTTLKPIEGSKRKRKKVTESDWQSYCSSSPFIKALVEDHGIDRFHREVIHLCWTKSEMSYWETPHQFVNDVLLSDEWYNDLVMCRIASKHVKSLSATTTQNAL